MLGAFDVAETTALRATLPVTEAPWSREVYTSAAGNNPLHPTVDRTVTSRPEFNESSADNAIPTDAGGPLGNPMGAQCVKGAARKATVTYVCGPPLTLDPDGIAAGDPATYLLTETQMQVTALPNCEFEITIALPEGIFFLLE